ncbi:DNA-processing protein DprA [Candidatus Saccharibacteria bacterium]|jgi:DNA processing protein|nr:DNA-processing protein DprA [Candidatus Saccharibacteria bacterium]HPR09029.1 DNA-processing protein DprA [Candidatus Saccharibacteria bacterium]
MKVKNLSINNSAYPSVLRTISAPPKNLYYLGAEPANWLQRPRVAVVGSRNISVYGRQVTLQLVRQLAERGITIVSGLALGVDAAAHSAALAAGSGTHIAVLAHGLDKIHPASNTQLARDLLKSGGVLLSEYPEGVPSLKQHFIARNRLVAGLADVLLIVEAGEKSGTLHTARFALEQGRDVLAVPGNITSPTSTGCNNLIKSGATPVTCVEDILHALKLDSLTTTKQVHRGDTPEEQIILDNLYQGVSDGYVLLSTTGLTADLFAQTLTTLELSGKIRPLGSNHWAPL